jgi:LPPG:FO 2-phospho-L-lactate transferase
VRVALLAGGGGGARFARGLHDVLGSDELTVVANVGDDLEILGLHVSPDLDSLLYALAGLIDEERGWGRERETWNALDSVAGWGGEHWFKLGDKDLGLHLVRSRELRRGRPLSEVTADLARRVELGVHLLPATDDPLRTHVVTPAGRFPFQEWFVGRSHRDDVDAVEYEGSEGARAAPGVLEAIVAADAILFAPSNPYLSIGPILGVGEIRRAQEDRATRCVAVSPLIAGAAVTGPLDRMLLRMAGGTTPRHLLNCYEGLVDVLVVDEADAPTSPTPDIISTQTLMRDRESARRLADFVLEAACA